MMLKNYQNQKNILFTILLLFQDKRIKKPFIFLQSFIIKKKMDNVKTRVKNNIKIVRVIIKIIKKKAPNTIYYNFVYQ